MSGEIYRTAEGIALTVRAGANPSQTFKGGEADLDTLMDKAANALLKETQPFVFMDLLARRGDVSSSFALAQKLTVVGSAPDRSFIPIWPTFW